MKSRFYFNKSMHFYLILSPLLIIVLIYGYIHGHCTLTKWYFNMDTWRTRLPLPLIVTNRHLLINKPAHGCQICCSDNLLRCTGTMLIFRDDVIWCCIGMVLVHCLLLFCWFTRWRWWWADVCKSFHDTLFDAVLLRDDWIPAFQYLFRAVFSVVYSFSAYNENQNKKLEKYFENICYGHLKKRLAQSIYHETIPRPLFVCSQFVFRGRLIKI